MGEFNLFKKLFSIGALSLLLLFSSTAIAASSIGSFIGSISGSVTAPDGTTHQPSGSVSATVDITTDAGGNISATVTGRGACNAGLGVVVDFTAIYDATANTLTGTYTDSGSSIARAITFTNTGGLAWTAAVSGTAPSTAGLLPYDVTMNIELPNTAIHAGTTLPASSSYSGPVAGTLSVSSTVGAPVNQTITLSPVLSGTWTATAVPLVDGSSRITGTVSGTMIAAPVNITVMGQTVPVSLSATFSGSLHTLNGALGFQGYWTDATGTYGGTMSMSIPVNPDGSINTFNVNYSGGFSTTQMGVTVPVTFTATGTIPLTMN